MIGAHQWQSVWCLGGGRRPLSTERCRSCGKIIHPEDPHTAPCGPQAIANGIQATAAYGPLPLTRRSPEERVAYLLDALA